MRANEVGLVVLLSAWLPSQSGTDAAQLVARLGGEQRAAARAQLVGMGADAVAALTADLAAVPPSVLVERLEILGAIGADAGGAVPGIVALWDRTDVGQFLAALVWTLGELLPYRPAGTAFDERRVAGAVARAKGGEDQLATATGVARLRVRAAFAVDADVAELVQAMRSCVAFRVELAAELLGRRGSAARAALPELRQALDRPDPRIVGSERRVPVRSKAARALLAMGADGADAELARAVLAGAPPAAPPSPTIPAAAVERVHELAAQLADPAAREAAVVNLVALGSFVAPLLAGELGGDRADAVGDAIVAVLTQLGPSAVDALPELLAVLSRTQEERAARVLRAIAAVAPWSRDVVVVSRVGSGRARMLVGGVDVDSWNALHGGESDLRAAMAVDPGGSAREFEQWLDDRDVRVRERALAIVRMRGAELRSLLPKLGVVLTAAQPPWRGLQEVQPGRFTSHKVDRTDVVHRLAAEAIVAIAAADDPLRAQAEAVLRGEPK